MTLCKCDNGIILGAPSMPAQRMRKEDGRRDFFLELYTQRLSQSCQGYMAPLSCECNSDQVYQIFRPFTVSAVAGCQPWECSCDEGKTFSPEPVDSLLTGQDDREIDSLLSKTRQMSQACQERASALVECECQGGLTLTAPLTRESLGRCQQWIGPCHCQDSRLVGATSSSSSDPKNLAKVPAVPEQTVLHTLGRQVRTTT